MSAVDAGNVTDGGSFQEVHSPLLDAVNTIIACLAVLGNGMVITVMLLRRRVFSSFTNRLILHQSVIDCIAGVVFFLYQVVLQDSQKTVSVVGNFYDQFICRVINSDLFMWSMNVTSTYNLVIISLERFMATCHPVRHRNMWSAAKLKFAVGSAWGVGFLYGSHFMLMFDAYQGHCRHLEVETGLQVLEVAVGCTIEFLAPMIILMYTYSQIIIMLTKKVSNQDNGPRNALMSKGKKNVLATTMLIAVMFAVCWTPTEGWFVYAHFSSDWGGWLYAAFTSLLACNMFVNPVIYCFKYQRFRAELRRITQNWFRGNRVGEGEAISTLDATTGMRS